MSERWLFSEKTDQNQSQTGLTRVEETSAMTVESKTVPHHILVLGGGIVGLNTALRLQKDFPTVKLTIMAENYLDKTVSQVAAGFFRATKGIRGPSQEVTQQWLRDAWSYYMNLKVTESSRDTGIVDVRFDLNFEALFPFRISISFLCRCPLTSSFPTKFPCLIHNLWKNFVKYEI